MWGLAHAVSRRLCAHRTDRHLRIQPWPFCRLPSARSVFWPSCPPPLPRCLFVFSFTSASRAGLLRPLFGSGLPVASPPRVRFFRAAWPTAHRSVATVFFLRYSAVLLPSALIFCPCLHDRVITLPRLLRCCPPSLLPRPWAFSLPRSPPRLSPVARVLVPGSLIRLCPDLVPLLACDVMLAARLWRFLLAFRPPAFGRICVISLAGVALFSAGASCFLPAGRARSLPMVTLRVVEAVPASTVCRLGFSPFECPSSTEPSRSAARPSWALCPVFASRLLRVFSPPPAPRLYPALRVLVPSSLIRLSPDPVPFLGL